MLFSYKELKRLAKLDDSIKLDDVVNAINSIGFEVEETYKFGDVENIKFGEIKNIYKNPNADKLNVCEIEFNDKQRTIQTNADNVFVGMKVVAFVPGSRMGEVVFSAKEMKGIDSEGMLSSLNEFGIDKELLRDGMADGIQSYENITLDMDPIEYLGLNDHIIDVDILSNRSDAQSYIIMAKELSAFFGTSVIDFNEQESTFKTDVVVKQTNDEMHLSLIEAKGEVNISLREIVLLAKSGIKSINDIVDLTNLTLIMTGQPTHAYDKTKLGNEFKIDYSSDKVNILGNKEVELNNNLTILSDGKPVSLAGVIGFEETGVSKDTNDFLLELGRFSTKEARRSLKTIKMNTQAGGQSSKAISEGTTKLGIDFLKSKLSNFSNVVNDIELKVKKVEYSISAFERVSEIDTTNDQGYAKAIEALKTLGFAFEDNYVTIPSYRHDVNSQQDLNEEILRFYGYDNLKLSAPKVSSFKVNKPNDIKTLASAMGYSEVQTYTLTSEKQNQFNPFGFNDSIKLETYISTEREYIRNSQSYSLLDVVEYNSKRNIKNINLFSVGMINDGINTIALASTMKEFNDLKIDIIRLIGKDLEFLPTTNEMLHPGVSADILLNGKNIGYVGKMHPRVSSVESWIAEIIINDETNKAIGFSEYSSDPLKTRDYTFELKTNDSISSFINDIECYEKMIIDEFLKDDINKVTVRFTLSEEQAIAFDEKFN